jgi:hypothetical protein
MVKLDRRTRLLAGLLAIGLVMAGGWMSTGTTTLTVVNDGMRIFYPWPRGLGSLICAAGLVLLTRAAGKTWLSVIGLLLAGVAAGGAFYQWTYRVEADGDAISARAFLGRRTLPWRDVLHVGTDPTVLVLQGTESRRVAIDTTDFAPTDRVRLARTITRRISEATGSVPIALGSNPARN